MTGSASARASLRAHPESLRLYAVTDNAWLAGRTLAQCCASAVRGGATFLQLRDKGASTEERVRLYGEIRRALSAAGERVPFVIDDDVEAASRCGADGVHVGQLDAACADARAALGEDAIVGVSVRTVGQALAAEREGADYLGVGALFATPTKPEAAEVSLGELARICEAVSIPVVGIGGLNARTVSTLAGTGVAGAAVVSGIFAADDIEAAARDLRARVDAALAPAR